MAGDVVLHCVKGAFCYQVGKNLWKFTSEILDGITEPDETPYFEQNLQKYAQRPNRYHSTRCDCKGEIVFKNSKWIPATWAEVLMDDNLFLAEILGHDWRSWTALLETNTGKPIRFANRRVTRAFWRRTTCFFVGPRNVDWSNKGLVEQSVVGTPGDIDMVVTANCHKVPPTTGRRDFRGLPAL